MPEFRDGLTTDMRYAVYALSREFGGAEPGDNEPVNFYGLFVKPPYEALLAYQVMKRDWRMTVYPVSPKLASVDGDACYPNLAALPGPVDAVISFLPGTRSARLAAEMRAAGVGVLWRMYAPWVNTLTGGERAVYEAAGIRLVEGCILQHWIAPGEVQGVERLRHACVLHGLRSHKVPAVSDEGVRGSGWKGETPSP
jgi:predicted CoA-binding protein